jgi:hypothetical protein
VIGGEHVNFDKEPLSFGADVTPTGRLEAWKAGQDVSAQSSNLPNEIDVLTECKIL